VSLDAALYPATAVGLTALSSGMDARLYRALRIERSLAYTIAGDLTPAATVPSALVLASCDPENVDEVVAVMDAEIARITTEPLSAAELQRAKRYLIGRQALRRQRNQEVAHYLALFELLGGSQGYRRDLLLAGEIATVDAAAVMVAMRRVFEPKWAVRLEGRRPTRAG
jgi:zinc protease